MNNKERIQKLFSEILSISEHDSYTLTRDEQSSIEWRVRDVEKYVIDLYNTKEKMAI